MRLCLLVLLLAAAPVLAQSPRSGAILLKAAPQDRSVFLQWNDAPGNGRYQIRWRRAGATAWQGTRSTGAVSHGAVLDLDNGVEHEFQVTKESGGRVMARSDVVRAAPRFRETFGKFWTGFVFTSQAAMGLWLDSMAIEPREMSCRQQPVTDWGPNAPDCSYNTPFGRVLLLRSADSVFRPTSPPPSPGLVRQVARELIWPLGNPWEYPGRFPATRAKAARADTGLVRRHAYAEAYVFATRTRSSSLATVFTPPSVVPGRVAIYIEGHGSFDQRGVVLGAPTIDWLLNRGWTVVSMDMPLMGANSLQASAQLQNHDDYHALDRGEGSPLAEFLLPVKAVVDWIEARWGAGVEILAVGRSGGGWTAYTYAALDPRITVVASAAGGLPMSLRLRENTPGDYEQTEPHFYGVVAHADLMVAAGARGAFYHFATRDYCCFRARPGEPFVRALEQAAARFGRRMTISVDPLSTDHGFSPASYDALDRFLNEVFGSGRMGR